MSRKVQECGSSSPDASSSSCHHRTHEVAGNTSRKSRAKEYGRKKNSRLHIPRLKSGCMYPSKILSVFKTTIKKALFSNPNPNPNRASGPKQGASSSSGVRPPSATKCYPAVAQFSPDSHYTEAIQDCIEFFKNSSLTE